MTAAMLLSLLAPLTRAFIPEPYELNGVAKLDTGVVLDDGSPIRSFVDGVDYSNKTSVFSRPGNTDGYFDIDTYGNHRTNATDPGTPWIKEGADDNEPIMYTWGDFSNNTQIGGPAQPWLQAKVFQETHDWQTGLPPQAGDLNLAPDAQQPIPLKIYSLTTNSTITPFTDYAWVCNPTNQNVDASQFYLQKDILGDSLGPQVQLPAGTIAPYERYFVDTADLNFFNEAGDNLKLVWKNTPGPSAAFGGNDIVVDRVEFNKTPAGGALSWEPGNTIMINEPWPDRGFQINRSTTYHDTNSVQQDFFTAIEDRKNLRPDPPVPVCVQNLCSTTDLSNPALYHITVLNNFRINWTHHDPNNDPQVAASIYIRDSFTQVWSGSTGAAQEITYNVLPLLTCTDYWVGVKTKDFGTLYGDFTELKFHTNCLPPPVNRLWPSNGWMTTPKSDQQVWWSLMTDNDPGDTLNYTWKVDDEITFTAPFISTGTTTNNYSDPFQTAELKTYYWCVDESDGWGAPISNCNVPWLFQTSQPPPHPTATELKVDGHAFGDAYLQRVTNRVPVLSWKFNPATRSQTAFHIQVLRDTDDFVMWDFNNTGAGGDLSTATYNSDSTGTALSNGTLYYFQVKVRDSLSPQLWSIDWGTPLDFYINTPPPVPAPLAPADDSARLVGSTIIYWSAVTDTDTGTPDTITYDFCIDSDNDPPYTTCNIVAISGIKSDNNSNAFTTVANNYIWAVRAYDSYEYSAWSVVWNFTAYVVTNNPPSISITAPTGGERLKQKDTFTITWTMDDAQDDNSVLVVVLTYSVGGGAAVTIATNLVGATSYVWTVPSDVDSAAVRITATVTDTGALTGTNQTPQFTIYKELEGEFPLMWVLLIIIIVVVLAIVLLFMMKRKKPKEEEEAAAPPAAEEAPPAEEEEMAEEETPAPPPKAAPRPAAVPAATKAPTKTKECASCGTIVSVTDKECFMCGAKL